MAMKVYGLPFLIPTTLSAAGLLAGCMAQTPNWPAMTLGPVHGYVASAMPPTSGTVQRDADTGALYSLLGMETAHGVIAKFRAGKVPREGGRLTRLERTAVYPADGAQEVQEMVIRMAKDPTVESVEPDAAINACLVPNDAEYNMQWVMSRVGMPEAWDVTTGKDAPLVAVIDSGVDYTHPDLDGQIVKGYDFVNEDDDPMDDNGHGTHCAGVIAALGDNAIGVSGVAPSAKVLAVKVVDSRNEGTTSAIAQGIDYAVSRGAKVISLSVGSGVNSMTLRSSVQKAQEAGVLLVAAAGNDHSSTEYWPAAYPGVVSVGAVDDHDRKTDFSNFGRWVTIAAPGYLTYSTTLGAAYQDMTGTSTAAPLVAGAAALMFARNPKLNATQVKQTLEANGDTCSGFEGNPALRRLNVAKALASKEAAVPTPGPSFQPTPEPTPTPSVIQTPVSVASQTPAPSSSAGKLIYYGASGNPSLGGQATIVWRTNYPADSMVEYGTSTDNLNRKTFSTGTVESHSVTLMNLAPGKIYYFRFHSKDADGNEVTSATMWFKAL